MLTHRLLSAMMIRLAYDKKPLQRNAVHLMFTPKKKLHFCRRQKKAKFYIQMSYNFMCRAFPEPEFIFDKLAF
jgi:hypothetical protein